MEKLYYSSERNVQILVALMKEHGVRKAVVSPGSTNICFVASLQHDPFFELYSCVDERSAAYMACGLAEESGEPVALSCTGATASRNYIPGLTEAFYRKLPVLAVTSTRPVEQIGHNIPQVMDRTNPLNDIAKISVYLRNVSTKDDEWGCVVNANRALLELTRHGGGPVHINLATTYSDDFSVKVLPEVRVIRRYEYGDLLPKLPVGTTAVYVGAHSIWDDRLTASVDQFCELYDALVLAEPISNYKGKYGVIASLLAHQYAVDAAFDNVIHIGNNTSGYPRVARRCVWRVNPDGEVRDTFGALEAVFEMRETEFFEKMCEIADIEPGPMGNYRKWASVQGQLMDKAADAEPHMPFCSIWIAMRSAMLVPEGSALHLAILNSLRSWSYFALPISVDCFSNTGGFGIDGCTSSLIGASLANRNRLYFLVTGDLAFFYDLNSLGNRQVGSNVRILLVNNGIGVEFKLNQTLSMRAGMGDMADSYVAAAGHFGKKSPDLVRHYVENLGFEYLSASSKDEYLSQANRFFDPEPHGRPMVFELFVDGDDDAVALDTIRNLETTPALTAKKAVKGVLGKKGVRTIKKILSR